MYFGKFKMAVVVWLTHQEAYDYYTDPDYIFGYSDAWASWRIERLEFKYDSGTVWYAVGLVDLFKQRGYAGHSNDGCYAV